MSRRKSIVNALKEKFKEIDGTGPYHTNLYNNSFAKLKFWDEVNDFPVIFTVAGPETREYQPAAFKWGFLSVSLKIYTKGEEPLELLEDLLEDVERVIDSTNGVLIYDAENNYTTQEISINSIITDEGLLAPFGVAEINLYIRYAIM